MDKKQIKQILARVPEGHDPKITITCREKLALIEENEKLKAALKAVANWQGADKNQVEHCINVLKELSND